MTSAARNAAAVILATAQERAARAAVQNEEAHVVVGLPHALDARAVAPDVRISARHFRTLGEATRTLAHGGNARTHPTVTDMPRDDASAIVERTDL